MSKKILKKIKRGFLLLLLLTILLMVTPRLLGWISPEKPPVGYHFDALTYLAAGTGLEKLADLNPEIPDDIEVFRDVEYKNVNGKSLQIDFYRPKNKQGPLPLIVFIHGGSWKSGNRSDYMVYLVSFAQKGYMTATISYRLLRDSIYPAAVADVTDAVDWLYESGETYNYNPDRIALVGGSAGGHLAMLAGYGWKGTSRDSIVTEGLPAKRKIKALVNIYGPADLTTEYARKQRLVNAFLGHSYDASPELYVEASPVHYLKPGLPPTMILHGTSDNLVPVSQSDTLKSRLDRLGVPCEYCRVPLWPHTMDMALRVNRYTQKRMEEFFILYL